MSSYIKGTRMHRFLIDEPSNEHCDTCNKQFRIGDRGIGTETGNGVFGMCSKCVKKAAEKLDIRTGCTCAAPCCDG